MKIDPETFEFKDMHHLITDSVVPRPIAWVSTLSKDGVFNLAPYSQFGIVCIKPPMIYIGVVEERDRTKKDTLVNIEYSKDFVIAVVTEALGDAMSISSEDFPPDVSEFKEAGLTPVKSDIVKAPLIAESPVNMECKLVQMIKLGGPPRGPRVTTMIIGEVVRFHIDDNYWTGEGIDVPKLKIIARLGSIVDPPYCVTTVPYDLKPIDFGR